MIGAVLLVALTGGIGSGKSTVAELLGRHGAVIVDADGVARQVVEPGRPALERLVERFGPGILAPDGTLDRPALGRVAFADDAARKDLESITHPAINEEFVRQIGAAPPDGIVVCDIPLLVESARAASGGYQDVIVVEAPLDVRLTRLESRGLPRDEALARMKAQATDEQRRAVATYVIDNAGSLDDLARQVDAVWASLHDKASRLASLHAKSSREVTPEAPE
ncbi:MAG: dephospho-CoA kinase [Actinobacteria bacterium]|nr:dephospho-CoA kinase [Actinomycetota bacterium]